jgi:hypothetical protein
MSRRITLLAVALFTLSALAGAATLPPSPAAPPAPAVVAPPAAASPAWLQPAPNSSVEKPSVITKPGQAPLGAIFTNACSQSCLHDEITCFNGCGGDQSCKQSCNDDYYCCLRFCTPNEPLCP